MPNRLTSRSECCGKHSKHFLVPARCNEVFCNEVVSHVPFLHARVAWKPQKKDRFQSLFPPWKCFTSLATLKDFHFRRIFTFGTLNRQTDWFGTTSCVSLLRIVSSDCLSFVCNVGMIFISRSCRLAFGFKVVSTTISETWCETSWKAAAVATLC